MTSSAPAPARTPDVALIPADALCVGAVIIDKGQRLTIIEGPVPVGDGLSMTCVTGTGAHPRTVTRAFAPDALVVIDRDTRPECPRCGVRGWVTVWNGGVRECETCDGSGSAPDAAPRHAAETPSNVEEA